ncbi:MAG: diguanylate cyclase domain-containing protein, partial [Pseudomonadales bacterium]
MKKIKLLNTVEVLPDQAGNKKGRWFRSLYLGLLILMVSALLVVGFSVWSNIYQQVNAELTPKTRSLADIMSRFLASQEETLVTIAEGFEIDNVKSKAAQDVLFNMTAATRQMKAVAILDTDNAILIASGEYQTGDWARLFPKESASLSAVGIPFRMTLFGESFIPIRVPIFDVENQLAGYLVAAYQIIGREGVWMDASVRHDIMQFTLASDKGLIYASVPEEPSFLQSFATARLAPQLLVELAHLDEEEIGRGSVDTNRGETLYNARKIQRFNGYVVVSVLTRKLWGEWFSQMKYAALIILCAALLGLLVLRISIRRAHVFEEEKYQAQNNVTKLSRAIEQSPSSVIVTDTDWITEYANKKLKDGSGQLIDIQMNVMLMSFFPHDLLLPDLEKITVSLNMGDNWYCERSVDHEQQWFSFSISKMSMEDGSGDNYIVITQNITERKKAEARLYNQAYYDSLTGLPNRRNSSQLLKKSLQEARENEQKVALVYLDLDNFKQVNDRYGHAVGDLLLQAVASRLDLVMRTVGTACHMSGDEFLV